MRYIGFLFIIDFIFFSTTNPSGGSSFTIILGCVLLAVTTYIVARLVLYAFGKAGGVSLAVQRRLSLAGALALTFLILMQSIGQLGTRDVLAIIPLAFTSYLYLSYVRKKETAHR